MKKFKLNSGEWSALAIFQMLFLITTSWAWLYRNLWALMLPLVLILICAAVLIAAVKAREVYCDEDLLPNAKVRTIALLVGAILLPLLSFGSGFGSQAEASAYLITHLDEMAEAQRGTAPGKPAKIDFLHGIPDGGLAIIRWDRKPTELSQQEQVSLTGERIKGCRRIIPDAWLCSFD